jgi:hypothetical protein
MKAIGKNIDNESIEFDFKSNIYCSNNQLTELNLSDGVELVSCFNNLIKEITLPISIKYVDLPLNCIVLNIEQFKNRNDITINFR